MPPRYLAGIVAAAVLALAVGCQPPALPSPAITLNSPPPMPAPAAGELPVDLRPYNWGRTGSCVHASNMYQLRWANREDMADWWRANKLGGETSSSIRRHCDEAGLRYAYTLSGDPAFLDWVHRTRRACLIWYYDRHCVTFVGFDDAGNAVINDNNRPTQHIRIPRDQFLRRWKNEFDGFALALLDSPVPPRLWPRFSHPVS